MAKENAIFKALRYMKAMIENGKSVESAAKVSARAFGLDANELLKLYKGDYEQ